MDVYSKDYILRSKISSDVLSCIECYEPEEYEEALNVLKRRYSGKSNTILQIRESIKKLPQLSSQKDITTFQILVEKTRELTRLIKKNSLGLSIEFETFKAIKNKMPSVISKDYIKSLRGTDPDLSNYLKFLDEELEYARQEEAYTTRPTEKVTKSPPLAKHQTYKKPINITEHRQPDNDYAAIEGLIPGQRYAEVMKRNLCINCLNKGHRINECKTTNRCITYKRKHHSLLCRSQEKVNTLKTEVQEKREEEKEEDSDEDFGKIFDQYVNPNQSIYAIWTCSQAYPTKKKNSSLIELQIQVNGCYDTNFKYR